MTSEVGLRDYIQRKMDVFNGIIQPDDRRSTPKERRDALNDAAGTMHLSNLLHLSLTAIEECSDESLVTFVQDWLDRIWQKHVLLYITAEETRWWDIVMHFDGYRDWNDEGPSREGRYRAINKAVEVLSRLDYLIWHSTGSDQYYRLNERGLAAKDALNASR